MGITFLTSTDPPTFRIGQPLAISVASFNEEDFTTILPLKVSLLETLTLFLIRPFYVLDSLQNVFWKYLPI